MKKKQPSQRELEAIETLRAAIKSLPRGIFFTVDDYEGTVEFWKRAAPGTAHGVAPVLRCKHAVVH